MRRCDNGVELIRSVESLSNPINDRDHADGKYRYDKKSHNGAPDEGHSVSKSSWCDRLNFGNLDVSYLSRIVSDDFRYAGFINHRVPKADEWFITTRQE
jgi:hypothetical protein